MGTVRRTRRTRASQGRVRNSAMTHSFQASTARQAFVLLALVALFLAVGAMGGAVTSTSVATCYHGLNKPSFNPPAWIFAPVWTTLYICMAVAAWRVWRRAGLKGALFALSLFATQLALNL